MRPVIFGEDRPIRGICPSETGQVAVAQDTADPDGGIAGSLSVSGQPCGGDAEKDDGGDDEPGMPTHHADPVRDAGARIARPDTGHR